MNKHLLSPELGLHPSIKTNYTTVIGEVYIAQNETQGAAISPEDQVCEMGADSGRQPPLRFQPRRRIPKRRRDHDSSRR